MEQNKMYLIRDREAGNIIGDNLTEAEAKALVIEFEGIDTKEGTYTKDFYEIVEMQQDKNTTTESLLEGMDVPARKREAEELAAAFGYNTQSLSLDVINVQDAYVRGYAKCYKTLSNQLTQLKEENEKVNRLLYDLTPMGSEFVNNPEYCAKWIKENREESNKTFKAVIADLKSTILPLKEENKRLKEQVEVMKHNNKTACILAMEFGYKQCEKGNNMEMAYLNYNEIINKSR